MFFQSFNSATSESFNTSVFQATPIRAIRSGYQKPFFFMPSA